MGAVSVNHMCAADIDCALPSTWRGGGRGSTTKRRGHMNTDVARRMNSLNAEFYRAQASSFCQTRQAPWPGWGRVVSLAGIAVTATPSTLSVLDVACGNLRFGTYLASRMASSPVPARVAYCAVDSCPSLVRRCAPPLPWKVDFTQIDLVERLLNGVPLAFPAPASAPADLTVCFGFMHHVPTWAARVALLRALLGATRPGGTCAVSLWQFMNSPRLARRARETTVEALGSLGLAPSDLDADDYLVGWQGLPDVWRYCHSFDADGITALVDAVSDLSTVRERFSSDGRTGNLNTYLVFRRHAAC